MTMDSVTFRLLRGIEEYDRMRNEIKQVVSMVCGLIQEEPKSLRVSTKTCSHGEITWKVSFSDDEYRKVGSVVFYPHGFVNVIGNSRHFEIIPIEYVKEVHRTLCHFIGEMVDAFPSIGIKIDLFLIAGDLAISKKINAAKR